MSAIGGIVRLDRQPLEPGVLERMCNQLAAYGRDAQAGWQGDGAGLMRSLLRCTPEDAFDRQPLGDEDYRLVFAGRLDNRRELLEQLGLPLAGSERLADAELALQACRRWDCRAPEFLLGSYALACWQPARRRLWLARDPIGQQPLFWHRQSGFFAFASLPKALFCIPGVPREVCQDSLLERISLLPMSGGGSFFKDIHRVEPGQLLLLEGERLSLRFFHRFDPHRELHLARDEDYVEALSEHLERAIGACLRSSGAVASHLSSGFDSSTVTALAARQLAARGEHLTAYTAVPREGFAGPVPHTRHADEGPIAARLVERFENIEHVLVRSGGTSPLEHLQTCIEEMDRAPQNPCNRVWMRAIEVDAQARGCRVLLTGERGNMTISYDGMPYLAALWRSGRWLTWWREVNACQALHWQGRRRGLAVRSIAPSLPSFVWRLLVARNTHRERLEDYAAIHPQWRALLTRRARELNWDLYYRPWHDGRAMRIAVLNRQDSGAMTFAAKLRGLDIRDPTSDLRLAEFCLSVPDAQYLRNGCNRWLLRRTVGHLLPPEILEGRSRGYQAGDWYESLCADRERLGESLQQLKAHPRASEMLDLAELERLWEEWPAESEWADRMVVRNYRQKLMRGIAVGSFIRYVEPDNR